MPRLAVACALAAALLAALFVWAPPNFLVVLYIGLACLAVRHRQAAAFVACLAAAICFGFLALAAPAMAAEVAAVGDKAVVLPWGDWLVAVLNVVVPTIAGLAMTYVTIKVGQVAPWAQAYLTNQRVESMVQNVTAYGMNAVAGAVKGQALTVPIGSAVIARAVQYGIDRAPAEVVAAAGGPAGLAAKVFRSLHLEPGATAANVLTPALDTIPLVAAK